MVYEHDYALDQLTVLPAGVNQRIQFTALADITLQ
jgi:hypothetical protein